MLLASEHAPHVPYEQLVPSAGVVAGPVAGLLHTGCIGTEGRGAC